MKNNLELTVAHTGKLWLSLVSLMPPTYQNRATGNRPDLMERLAEMHPSFLRLPGGNYLEGDQIDERYNRKTTTGPVVDRLRCVGPRGIISLPMGRPPPLSGGGARLFYSVTTNPARGTVHVKLVNTSSDP